MSDWSIGDWIGLGSLGLMGGGMLYNWLNDDEDQYAQQQLNLLNDAQQRAAGYAQQAINVPLTDYGNIAYSAGNPIGFNAMATPTAVEDTGAPYMTDALENYAAINNALARGETPPEWALGAQQLENSALRALATDRNRIAGSARNSGNAIRQSLNQDSANLLADMQRNTYQTNLAMQPQMMAGQVQAANAASSNPLARFNQDWLQKTNMFNTQGQNVANEANTRRAWATGDQNTNLAIAKAKSPFEEKMRQVSTAAGVPTYTSDFAQALGNRAYSEATAGNAAATMGAGLLGNLSQNQDFTKQKINLFGA
jgi:hypothetical protein